MNRNFRRHVQAFGITTAVLAASAGPAQAEEAYKVQRTRLIGSAQADYAAELLIDPLGNLFINATTSGDFDGNTAVRLEDFALAKLDDSGQTIWSTQFGTQTRDYGIGLAMDPTGNVFYGGYSGNSNHDIVLAKHDPLGQEVWARQIGTPGTEFGGHVATDSLGNVYITGQTDGALPGQTNQGWYDAFISKYDTTGNHLWTRQFGTAELDAAGSLATDSAGNIYVTGITQGGLDGHTNAGSRDGFLAKFDTSGNQLWLTQFGTTELDSSSEVKIDPTGNLYVTGYTHGEFSGNTSNTNSDAYLMKFDPTGAPLWTQQFGTSGNDFGTSMALNAGGDIYLAGSAGGAFDDNRNAGYSDVMMVKFDTNGDQLWAQQFGSAENDYGYSVALDAEGLPWITGRTWGDLNGHNNLGESDAYVVRLAPPVQGDLNSDWYVGLGDLDILLAQWNQTNTHDYGLTLTDFNGFGFTQTYNLWNTGTLTTGPDDLHIQALDYGGGWVDLAEPLDASGLTHLELDLDVNPGNEAGSFVVVLIDEDGTQRVFRFDDLAEEGRQIHTIHLDDFEREIAIGHIPGLDLTVITRFHLQGGANMALPGHLIDLTLNHLAFTDGYVPAIFGDINGDHFIGLDDLDTVLQNWNAGTPPSATADDAIIPEPASAAVLGLALMASLANRPRVTSRLKARAV